MAIPKITGAQRDFSAGEVDVALKRADDHEARKKGVRQLSNMRILNSAAVQNRPGRRALYPISNAAPRTERFTHVPGVQLDISFSANRVKLIDSTGAVIANFTTQGNGAALPWVSTNDINNIRFAVFNFNIYICFGNSMRPQVLVFTPGANTWAISDYTEAISVSSQKRTPFYRLSPQNVTMQPSGTLGNITLSFSSAIAVLQMVGTRMRYAGRQVLITAINNPLSVNALVIEPLPPGQTLALTTPSGNFAIGDVVLGSSSGAKGIVTGSPTSQALESTTQLTTQMQVGDSVTGGTSGATGVVTGLYSGNLLVTVSLNTGTAFVASEVVTGPHGNFTTLAVSPVNLNVQVIQTSSGAIAVFTTSDKVAGPSGSASISTVTNIAPQAISVWDDEIINAFRGYPASCFVDQFRLGFCQFPTSSIAGGIAWSAINSPTDLYVDATPSNAMFEIAPNKVQVYDVVPGPEGSEFVFCDRRVYYIPINASNPLKPGGVSFQTISVDGSSPQAQPRVANELIFYAGNSGNSIKAVIATGAYLRPYNTKNITQFASHLFSNIIALAAPTSDGTFTERYIYALTSSGAVLCGKYALGSIEKDEVVGWGGWSGGGTVSWISANNADVVFSTSYFGTPILEILDDTQYVDGALSVNALPSTFTPPGGKGPLWWIPSQTVTLMDQVTRAMGVYNIDANGFIIPQFNGGENLSIASLVAGQAWTATLEPFVPDANPGTSVHQRMFKRRVSRMAVYVSNSTGFMLARLFSGPLSRTSPALGTIMNFFRVPTWNQDDDPTAPPPLREEAQRWRPIGRAFDPRVALVKDTPGPLLVHEFGLEASI